MNTYNILNLVFQQLQEAGLRVNPKKSQVGFKELNYLGYTVGGGQLRSPKKKIAAIAQAVLPRTKKQLGQFLSLIGYYSSFMQNRHHRFPSH